MKLSVLPAAALCLGLFGCAASAPVTPANYQFDPGSTTALDLCLVLTERVMHLGEDKLGGMSEDAAMQSWTSGTPGSHTLSAEVVHGVYLDSFDNAGDYGIGYFGRCAAKYAQVPEAGLGKAQHCFAKALLVQNVEYLREQGKSKAEAYQSLAGLRPDALKEIVENVYGLPQPRPNIRLEAFEACIGKTANWGAQAVPQTPMN